MRANLSVSTDADLYAYDIELPIIGRLKKSMHISLI
jgi:hypothetical protein